MTGFVVQGHIFYILTASLLYFKNKELNRSSEHHDRSWEEQRNIRSVMEL